MNAPGLIELSVVLPVYNEEECVADTVRELRGVLAQLGRTFEIVAVNDGSTDGTREILRQLAREYPELRLYTLRPNSGQSAALEVAFREARGAVIITMDADGQNDPADIPALLAMLQSHDACLGYRRRRRDAWSKRIGSRLANRVRNRVLHEDIMDTGCALRVFKAEFVRGLTMWKGMHRFLPALTRMRGAAIAQVSVNHRPRTRGKSKYTNFQRLRETIGDLRAVRWMQKRNCRYEVEVG
jgi:glycosyltransferase involved in cell wall biosynthesis